MSALTENAVRSALARADWTVKFIESVYPSDGKTPVHPSRILTIKAQVDADRRFLADQAGLNIDGSPIT